MTPSPLSDHAEPIIQSVLMQATQRLRQFHRIGKSATAACRSNLERAHRQGLEGLCSHLADVAASGRVAALDRSQARAAVMAELRRFHAAFLDHLEQPLRAMEGWDEQALAAELARRLDAVDDALGQFAQWDDIALPSLDVLCSATGRRRAGFFLEEAYRCLEAEAWNAAAVFCACALEEVTSDPAAAHFTIQADPDTQSLADVTTLLERTDRLHRDSVLRLWNLVATTCSVIAESRDETPD